MFKTLFPKISCLILFVALGASVITSQTESSIQPTPEQPQGSPTPAITDNATLNLHRWGAVTLFHGLPSDRVNAIAEDARGLMWFGTDNGLVRYDGRNVETLPGEAALPSRRVLTLKLDAHGGVWIGTDAGAARWHDERVEVLEETRGRAVNSISLSAQNEILLVTQGGEIFRYSAPSQNKISSESVETAKPVTALALVKLDPATNPAQLKTPNQAEEALPLTAATATTSGEWAIGSGGRGLLLHQGSVIREADVKSARPYFVSSVFSTGDRLWLGEFANQRTGALWLFSADKMKRLPIETEAVRAIGGGDDELWLGTNRRGAFLLKPEGDEARLIEHLTFDNTAGGLRSNQVNAVFRDREGIVWFGTDRGVCRYDRESFRVATPSGDSQSNYVRDLLLASNAEVWSGTNRGLFRLASPESASVPITEIENRSVYALFEDAAGAIWAGTSGGLFVKTRDAANFSRITDAPNTEITIEGENASTSMPDSAAAGSSVNPPATVPSQSVIPPSKESVRAIASFRGQVYAAYFGRGIERIDGEKRVPVLPQLSEPAAQRAICLAAEADQSLWVGTSDGELWRYDGSQFRQIETPLKQQPGQGEKAIRTIVFDGKRLWIATSQGLLVREGESFREVRGGLDVQDLLVIRETPDREVAWIATKNAGLIKLLPDENVSIRFDTEQGLSSQQVFALASPASGSHIWIGTNRGVIHHRPSSIQPRVSVKRLVADRIYQAPELVAELALPHTLKNFLLEVSGIGSKTFPSQFQYEFSLQTRFGEPMKTVRTNDPQFAPGDLQSGGYMVVVRSISRDLVYSDPLTVRLRIQRAPFPWGTLLLASLLAAAIAAAAWAFRQQLRLGKTNVTLAHTNAELRETRLRLASETEAERSRIARDLHDQTLADLRHLLVLTDQLPVNDENIHAPTPGELRREIESVSKEIRRICEDLSPSALQNLGFLPALEGALSDAVAQLPAEEKFAYEFVCEPELEDRLQLTEIEQIQLYRIVQEALNNVCRHAAAQQVRLVVRAVSNDLLIEVCDDGKGLTGMAGNRTGHGLANIRSRANLIGAQVSWQDAKPGCRFELRKTQAIS